MSVALSEVYGKSEGKISRKEYRPTDILMLRL
jgi:hypothetical protein